MHVIQVKNNHIFFTLSPFHSLGKSTNKHYICSLPPHRSPIFGEPRTTLLRLFKHPVLANKVVRSSMSFLLFYDNQRFADAVGVEDVVFEGCPQGF